MYYDDADILKPLNHCLVEWTGKYLRLYAKNLFNLLDNTDGAYNNTVWLDLEYLYWIICKDPERCGKNLISSSYITIGRNSSVTRQNQINYNRAFQITDQQLLDDAINTAD